MKPKISDLNSLITNALPMIRRLVSEDIEIVVTLDPELARVSIDPGQIEQVLVNLIINSRDAMPNGGRIMIETKNVTLGQKLASQHWEIPLGEYVVMEISDTGIGIPEDILPYIFEPFFTTKEVGEGTGLGLSICSGIVSQSDGIIIVDSKPDEGSSFKVFLPAATDNFLRIIPNDPSEVPVDIVTVLVVEDEPTVLNAIRHVLSQSGYIVLVSANAREARDIARKEKRIDLLITDVVMPVMSGRELAIELVELFPDMKVLYISGYTDDVVLRHGISVGNVEFLQKPFTSNVLAHKVREVLNSKYTS
jgi:CheY-like chemotaxis protein